MSENQNIPWKRLSLEAATIVGSIILAFTIDAWWDERVERNEETEQLNRLRAEFSTNIDRIDQFMAPLTLQASVEVYELIEVALSRDVTNIDIPTVLLSRMLATPTFEANTPILNGLIRSGRLEIIEDEGVLMPLAAWERQFRGYTEQAVRTRYNADSRLLPALTLRGDIGPALHRRGPDSDFRSADANFAEVTPIRIDTQLKGLIAERVANSRSSAGAMDRARAMAEDVVASIEASQLN